MILYSNSSRKFMNPQETQIKRIDFYSKTFTLAVTVIAMGVLFSFSSTMEKGILITDYNVYAQSEQPPQQEEEQPHGGVQGP